MDESTGAAPIVATPWWAWIFVAGCIIIPVVSLGGAIPGAIGGGGAAGCYALSRSIKHSFAIRLAGCIATFLLCWMVFLGFAYAVRSGAA